MRGRDSKIVGERAGCLSIGLGLGEEWREELKVVLYRY